MEAFIRFKDVFYCYDGESDDAPALNGANLDIEEGSFVAILGHNGSGKSTLAKHFNGILLPQRGNVRVCGMDTRDESRLLEIRKTVGMVFQNPDNQIVSSIVEDDVAFAPENLGVPSAEIRSRVDNALRLVDMYEYRRHSPHLLSGGQKQRVAIAGVIAMEPRCIVLDEPTAMLDPQGRREVLQTIEKLCRENGITVILITHHMEEAINADQVFVMKDGVFICGGPPCVVFSDFVRLKSLGLAVPYTTELIYRLNRDGFKLNCAALSVNDCADEIAAYLKNKS